MGTTFPWSICASRGPQATGVGGAAAVMRRAEAPRGAGRGRGEALPVPLLILDVERIRRQREHLARLHHREAVLRVVVVEQLEPRVLHRLRVDEPAPRRLLP